MTVVRLRHLAQVNPATPAFDRLHDNDEVTFLPMEVIWPDNRLDISQRRVKASVSTGYTRFQDGDVLVPKITPTFEAARSVLINGLYCGVGAGTTELHVLRPKSEVDARFLLYVTNTHGFLKLGKAEMYGVAGQQRVPDEFIRDYAVELPSLTAQRRIADFLDTETARIDKLADARKEQVKLMTERLDAIRNELFTDSPNYTPTPLMHLTDPTRPIVYGIVQAGPEIQDGIPYIKTGDLENLRINSLSRTSREIHNQYKRAAVHPGDIVMAMRASIGAVALVPDDIPEANLTQGTARIAARQGIDRRWLLQALQARSVQEQCQVRAVGSTFRTLNIWDLRRVVINVSPERTRDQQLDYLESSLARHRAITSSAVKQGVLLAERRQALITAAVTGQFDVSTASGRGVTE
ncbi:restriction endonuclease subunit S [Actinomadura coerulea]|uniref:restriction endonuclease subunit S n=1 Tax=Actinomadura coerulea TaxID=46159 RepID=UPI003417E7C6